MLMFLTHGKHKIIPSPLIVRVNTLMILNLTKLIYRFNAIRMNSQGYANWQDDSKIFMEMKIIQNRIILKSGNVWKFTTTWFWDLL